MARAPLDREIAAHSALQKEAPSAKSMTDEAPRKHYLYYNNYIFIPNLKRLTAKCRSCDPGATQTHDLQNRNLTLYSTKLRGPIAPQI